MIKDFIKPINSTHSIKEAVITVFLSNPIVKPERFLKLMDTSGYAEWFQKADNIDGFKIGIRGNKEGLEANSPELKKNIGFRFASFKNGKTDYVLQGLNEDNRTFISFHSLIYDRWKSFCEHYSKVTQELNSIQSEFYVNAISLNYVDSFFWLKESEIDVSEIFVKENELLPNSFFESSNTNYSLSLENNKENKRTLERLIVNVDSNTNNEINVSHVVTTKLADSIDLKDLISTNEIFDILDQAHINNKSILKKLFNKDVLELINLT